MTPESQRLALSKWAGWKLSTKSFNGRTGYRYERGDESASSGGGLFGWGWQSSEESAQKHLPDYLHDLNAVQTLLSKWAPDKNEMESYLRNLKAIVAPHYEPHEVLCVWCMVNATTARRCETLLRTLGLWEA